VSASPPRSLYPRQSVHLIGDCRSAFAVGKNEAVLPGVTDFHFAAAVRTQVIHNGDRKRAHSVQ